MLDLKTVYYLSCSANFFSSFPSFVFQRGCLWNYCNLTRYFRIRLKPANWGRASPSLRIYEDADINAPKRGLRFKPVSIITFVCCSVPPGTSLIESHSEHEKPVCRCFTFRAFLALLRFSVCTWILPLTGPTQSRAVSKSRSGREVHGGCVLEPQLALPKLVFRNALQHVIMYSAFSFFT